MWRFRSILGSALALAVLAVGARADGWVHSSDGRKIDRIAQPLPFTAVDLTTGQACGLSTNDPVRASWCGWWHVQRATQPTGTVVVARGWAITNGYAQEVLTLTNKPVCAARNLARPVKAVAK